MSLILACLCAAGVLLAVSPLLWPTSGRAPRAARGGGALDGLRLRLALAGMPGVPVSAFIAVSGIVGLTFGALAQAALGVVALAAAVTVVGAVLPTLVVSMRASARRRANRAVWPDAVDQLVASVRSGLALPDSLATLAHVGPPATRPAFTAFERDYRVTGNFQRSVDTVKERLADPVADRILETLRMAREVGGTDLTRVLRALAASLREESAIRSEVAARQSWVTNAARLGVAAPWLVLLLLATRPEAAQAYNSPTGVTVVVAGLVVSVIAYRLIRRLGRLPEEKRWFR
ncbi:type II secretion system F family protein [Microbacterium sp. STN6]|uniref:type II secretion system F family protein n=1 Tax=Microbacterium sp. STN6 TaxID=2995588 RepID=UPI00226095E4|nr:type II secretion system F family protein [Microbacterium sp. STN6]MCX7521999.1 type II secretion system F family protein [Microbacterium sp. STN6]